MSRTFGVHEIVKQDSFCMHAYTAQSKMVSIDNGLCSLFTINLLCCFCTLLKLHKLVGPTEEPLCPSVCAWVYILITQPVGGF